MKQAVGLTSSLRKHAESAILAALPGRAQDLARLRFMDSERRPVVTVVGKYNHGKSRLLNELIGHSVFSVADKRETTELSRHAHDSVCWLDAPGLDADVNTVDDDHALQAIWLQSDIRLFVHAAKEGELDGRELALLQSLIEDGQRTRRQTLLVMSQVDQLAGESQHQAVVQSIRGQVPTLELHQVSSTRYRQGTEGGKALLVERSGIPALQLSLRQALDGVAHARAHERALLLDEARQDMRQLCAMREDLRIELQSRQSQQRHKFDQDLRAVLDKVRVDIQTLLDVPGPDHSRTPDSFENQFKITQGKLERNRLQVGYSKACIEINAVLIKHGVTDLPEVQKTQVRSLDSVIVAVMGVYVKYRKDLREIFCEDSGRARLLAEFARYFELSADRVELASSLESAQIGLRIARQGAAALEMLVQPEASA